MTEQNYKNSLQFALIELTTNPGIAASKLLMLLFCLPVERSLNREEAMKVYNKRQQELQFWLIVAKNLAQREALGEMLC